MDRIIQQSAEILQKLVIFCRTPNPQPQHEIYFFSWLYKKQTLTNSVRTPSQGESRQAQGLALSAPGQPRPRKLPKDRSLNQIMITTGSACSQSRKAEKCTTSVCLQHNRSIFVHFCRIHRNTESRNDQFCHGNKGKCCCSV